MVDGLHKEDQFYLQTLEAEPTRTTDNKAPCVQICSEMWQPPCCSHLIHAVDPHMRQERPQVGVRQDVILGDPRQDLHTAARSCTHRGLHARLPSHAPSQPGLRHVACNVIARCRPPDLCHSGLACCAGSKHLCVVAQSQCCHGGPIRHLLRCQPPQHLAGQRCKRRRHALELLLLCTRISTV